jgi:hypothetical protein
VATSAERHLAPEAGDRKLTAALPVQRAADGEAPLALAAPGTSAPVTTRRPSFGPAPVPLPVQRTPPTTGTSTVATTAVPSIGTGATNSNSNSNGSATATGTGTGTAASSTNAETAGGPGNTAAHPGPSNLELDSLAASLYERIASRLRTELRLDRERVGLLTDIHR